MRQPLSSLTRWVVAGLLAGLATGAVADGFLLVNGTFSTINVPYVYSSMAYLPWPPALPASALITLP